MFLFIIIVVVFILFILNHITFNNKCNFLIAMEINKTTHNLEISKGLTNMQKIIIIKCSNKELWYAEKIGKTFEIADVFKNTYSVYYGIGECQVLKKDCKIIRDKCPRFWDKEQK